MERREERHRGAPRVVGAGTVVAADDLRRVAAAAVRIARDMRGREP